jgi:hypothetical protein|tara:strand:- start:89 stop:274 length:186 start_codon:yes stop_codon:yes gene_type:complete
LSFVKFCKARRLKSPLVDIFKKLMLFVGIYRCSSAPPPGKENRGLVKQMVDHQEQILQKRE